ncbi:MAG: MBL fold metallo-hydrolase RNA specificity domain-containing protein [Legionellaceae bacterium]
MDIRFLGATQTVTGSKYLIQAGQVRILVDCGLFQGHKELRLRNWDPLPIDPATIDYVLLTHAHIDHSGYIPLLVKYGFRGTIMCTQATRDLCKILLPDSGHLQEEEARYANHRGYSKHHPAQPLYTQEEAETSLQYFKTVAFEKPFKIHDEIYSSFHYAGHILGASFIRLEYKGVSVLFSGDLGRSVDPVMNPPQTPPESDYLVVESTYGDRLHDKTDPELQLKEIINRTAKRGGTLLIPAFAVGRTQLLLYYIQQLKSKKEIFDIPVFVDSPMATNATDIFSLHAGENRLNRQQCADVCNVAQYIRSVEESIALRDHNMPMIIISASGMATGGRVVHHIKNYAPNHKNTILLSGFQASGTRGDRLVKGEKELKMFGEMVPIRAEVIQLESTSAHADYEDMLSWLGYLKKTPRKIFITHGEKKSALALKEKIEEKFNWPCLVPEYLDQFKL